VRPKDADAAVRVGGTCGPTGSTMASGIRFLGFLPFFALVEAVAVTVHLKDMNVMGETVEQRPCQALGAEHLSPLIEGRLLVSSVEPRS